MFALAWSGLLLASYLIGGIPTAYLATRLLKGQDIRQIGDRNAGAANVYRNVGPKAGFAVGVIDIAKGAVAILLVKVLVDSTCLQMAAGVAVLAGHNWPIHLRLHGGRGAATAVGVLLATLPALAVPVGLLALVVLYLTNRAIMSLGFFLATVPVGAGLILWVGTHSYSYAISAYALGIPPFVALSHYLSLRFNVYPGPLVPETAGQPIEHPG